MIKKIINILLIISSLIFAKDIKIDGLAESYHAFKLNQDGETIGERNRARLNFRKQENNIYALISLRARQNQIIGEGKSRVELYESYVEIFQPNWDLRIGRQIFNWGKADGIRITDALSPVDYREFLTRDFDEIRMPIEAAKFRYLLAMSDLEFIWIPRFEPAELPNDPQNPWYVSQNIPAGFQIGAPNKPELSLKNSEIAMRYNIFLNGIDISLSSSYLWDDFPVWIKSKGKIRPTYHRLINSGVALSKPFNDFVVRFEGAMLGGKHFQTNDSRVATEKQSAKYLLGLDWYPGNNLTISGQVGNEQYIFDHSDELISEQNNYLVTLNIQKQFFREKLELENMFYYGFADNDIFERLSADYALTDNFHLAAGVDIFTGDQGYFGNYDKNDSFWIKAKYNF